MTTVLEIKTAIERLSLKEVKEVLTWLEEYQQMIKATAKIFSSYDQEEKVEFSI